MTDGSTEEDVVDWAIVGSGFGGSVSALRLAEKGWSVTVLESGRRFEDEDFATTTWNLRRYFWAPVIGLRGILRLTVFRDIFIATGAGVGGGSLGYANTLYRPESDAFYDDPSWRDLADWRAELAPHYDTATRMLGVTTYGPMGAADDLIRRFGEETGVGHTFEPTPVGVFLGEPDVEVADPYFGGAGPRRTGCTRCGACMVGCRVGAKNTLMKNYLHLAERAGARILPEREVVDVAPLGPSLDGSDGWELTTVRPGWWVRPRRRRHLARSVVLAGGALGTTSLLLSLREGSLPSLSQQVGHQVRTNSESILAITAPRGAADFTETVAISSSIHADPHTAIEPVSYGVGGGAIAMLSTLLVPDGTRLTRPLKFLGQVARHPLRFVRLLWPGGWSRRTFLVLVMQSHDNAIRLISRRRWIFRGRKLRTSQDADRPIPTFIPIANEAASRMAEYVQGVPQSSVMEALFNIPTTAHLLGGATIGVNADHGVVDHQHHVYGYANLLVCDGSVIPANVGVNPSLTITALAERAMTFIMPRDPESAVDHVGIDAGTHIGPTADAAGPDMSI